MKGQNKSWKRYSSCVTLNHCLLTFLIIVSSVNYSHNFKLIPWPEARAPQSHQEPPEEYPTLCTEIDDDATTQESIKIVIADFPTYPLPGPEHENTPKTPEDNSSRTKDEKVVIFPPDETGWLPVMCDIREFACHSRRLCIKPHLVCDGINDCDDGSDELTCESVTEMFSPDFLCMNDACPRSYERDPSPPHCARRDLRNIACKHHKGKVPLVVFSTLNALYETNLPEDRSKIHVNKTNKLNLSGISAFDYENVRDALIWLDKNKNKIFVAKFLLRSSETDYNSIHRRETSMYGLHKIHGFVFDWLSYALIWIDDYGIRSETLQKPFFYDEPKTKIYRILNPSFDRPGSITIDVMRQCIFWTNIGADTNNPFEYFPKYIERINLRGEPKPEKIVERNILRPVGLAIDTENTKVYWIDGLYRTLESAEYDGTNRITLCESLPLMDEVISMDIFTNYLYFTDKVNSTIQRININNAVSKVDTFVTVPDGPPTLVKIVDPKPQIMSYFNLDSRNEILSSD